MQNGIAFDAERVEPFSYLPHSRAGALTKPIVDAPRVMTSKRDTAESVCCLAAKMQGTEAARKAFSDRAPAQIMAKPVMIGGT